MRSLICAARSSARWHCYPPLLRRSDRAACRACWRRWRAQRPRCGRSRLGGRGGGARAHEGLSCWLARNAQPAACCGGRRPPGARPPAAPRPRQDRCGLLRFCCLGRAAAPPSHLIAAGAVRPRQAPPPPASASAALSAPVPRPSHLPAILHGQRRCCAPTPSAATTCCAGSAHRPALRRPTIRPQVLYAHTKHRYDLLDMEFLDQLAGLGLACQEVGG